jgi:hypothetical protein
VKENEMTRTLGRSWYRWEDNIRMDFREIGWEGVEWIHLAQWRSLMRTNEPSVFIKVREFLD